MSVSTADLKRLGEVKAPAGLAQRVLAGAGLADEYARFDTVIGAVFVAWNRSGVSAAARSNSAHEFEEYFRAEVGRRPLRPGTPSPEMAHRITDELSGKRTLRFDLRGLTEFEQAVPRKALQGGARRSATCGGVTIGRRPRLRAFARARAADRWRLS